jgi:hypothetical protein
VDNYAGFSNIPQTYQDLMIVVSGTSPQNQDFWTNINGLGTNLNSATGLVGDGSISASYRQTNGGQWFGPSMSSMFPFSAVMNILNYSNATSNKTMLLQWAADRNGSGQSILFVGLGRTTSAVTSWQLNCQITGTVTLYGVRSIGQ